MTAKSIMYPCGCLYWFKVPEDDSQITMHAYKLCRKHDEQLTGGSVYNG